MRGRKPKPTHLRIIEGNPGHRPLNKDEPIPEGDLGAPPEWMAEREQQIWREALRSAPEGMVKNLDASAFAGWVGAYASWELAKQKVSAHGLMVKSPVQALPMQNPYLAIQNKQAIIMVKFAAELGFTPSARSRVKLDKGKRASPFSDLKDLTDLD